LEILYEAKIKMYFEDYILMKNKIGSDTTKLIKKRIDQLKASQSFASYLEYNLGKPHPLKGKLKGCYGVNITGNLRLVFHPTTDILDKCNKIMIKGVVDYHGSKENWYIP
jgi:proteic killer suppression protein/toxin YoeB